MQQIPLSFAFLTILSLVSCRPTIPPPTPPRPVPPMEAVDVTAPIAPEPASTVSNAPTDISEEEAVQRAREYLLTATHSDELPRELWLDSCQVRCIRASTFRTDAPPEKECRLWNCLAFYSEDRIYLPGSVNFTMDVSADSVTDSLHGIGRCYGKPHRCRLLVSGAQARKIAGVSGKSWTARLTWDDAAGEFVWSVERTSEQPANDGRTIGRKVSAHSKVSGR